MNPTEDFDDLTEVAADRAPAIDDIDDEVTDIVTNRAVDDLGDDTTAVMAQQSQTDAVGEQPSVADDLFDDVTGVMAPQQSQTDAVGEQPSVADDLFDDVTGVMGSRAPAADAVGEQPTRADGPSEDTTAVMERQPIADSTPPTQVAAAPTTSTRVPTAVSLRDRVPESRDRWEPPRRPRSPEFEAPVATTRRPLFPIIAAALLVMALLIGAVLLTRPDNAEDDGSAPLSDTTDEVIDAD